MDISFIILIKTKDLHTWYEGLFLIKNIFLLKTFGRRDWPLSSRRPPGHAYYGLMCDVLPERQTLETGYFRTILRPAARYGFPSIPVSMKDRPCVCPGFMSGMHWTIALAGSKNCVAFDS